MENNIKAKEIEPPNLKSHEAEDNIRRLRSARIPELAEVKTPIDSKQVESEEENFEDTVENLSSEDFLLSEMENSMRPPPILTFEGNVKEKWRKWKQAFELYLEATGLVEKSESRQVAVLLTAIGEEAREKFNTFELSEEERKSISKVVSAFDNYCEPKENETIDRHIFFTRVQHEGERMSNYITELKKLSVSCKFEGLKESLIRDRIIIGITDSEVRNKLLQEAIAKKLTLEQAEEICKSSELTESHLKTLESEVKVHAINTRHTGSSEKSDKYNNNNCERQTHTCCCTSSRVGTGQQQHQQQQQQRWQQRQSNISRPCKRCGTRHNYGECPAYMKTCELCGHKGHFRSMCEFEAVNAVECTEEDAYDVEALYID